MDRRCISLSLGVKSMEYYKYGKFRPRDYCGSWVGITILLIFVIASIILDLSTLYIVFPTIYAAIWLWIILLPNRERFIINKASITVLQGRKIREIPIPLELTLVVSYADICPPFAVRTVVGNQTHILKDKYAVSILRKMPLDIVLETVHRNFVQKYTTSIIQKRFNEYHYIYSFVCDQFLLDQLLTNRDCFLIIPQSLSEKVDFTTEAENIYIDIGY